LETLFELGLSQEKVGPESDFANTRAFLKPESLSRKKPSLNNSHAKEFRRRIMNPTCLE
jgi:hypothetical protein